MRWQIEPQIGWFTLFCPLPFKSMFPYQCLLFSSGYPFCAQCGYINSSNSKRCCCSLWWEECVESLMSALKPQCNYRSWEKGLKLTGLLSKLNSCNFSKVPTILVFNVSFSTKKLNNQFQCFSSILKNSKSMNIWIFFISKVYLLDTSCLLLKSILSVQQLTCISCILNHDWFPN